jgi:DNA-binding transcriptional regulator YiaG
MTTEQLASLRRWAEVATPVVGVAQVSQVLALLDDHARIAALVDELMTRVAESEAEKPKWTKASGKKIRKRRNDLGLSLIPPAKHLGVSIVTLSKWERADGGPTDGQLRKLGEYYQHMANQTNINEEKQGS